MYSIYIHIPFCGHRCAYCDFNTYAGKEAIIPDYVDALCNEIRIVGASAPVRLHAHTIFFGGGTPSLLRPTQFEGILNTIREQFDVLFDAETTVEANPGTCTFADLLALRHLGINRLSFGVQSANPDELRQLERIHNFFDVIDSVKWARQARFDNLNLDLIYGLPEQTLECWQFTVRRAVALNPEHLSLYALTLEQGTPFGRWAARGMMPVPNPDLAAEMYEWAEETLEVAGYMQYEISNWALTARRTTCAVPTQPANLSAVQPHYACRHNLQYWRNQPYLGFGAGAHGFAGGFRVANVLRVKTYIERCAAPLVSHDSFPFSPATSNRLRSSVKTEMQENMITGLRLTLEGVPASTFQARFGVTLQEAFGKEIDELIRLGLLEWANMPPSSILGEGTGVRATLRLTRRGRLLGNQVFMRFV